MKSYMRCYAQISLDAIEHNIAQVRAKVGEDVKILAVIKADGYGHGSIPVAKRLMSKVQYFAVATIEEAIELRQAGIDLPILILGYTSPRQYDEVVRYDVTQTIYSYDTAAKLDEAAKCAGKKSKIHIALDTGMTRIGFVMDDESVNDVVRINQLENVEVEGIFSHFSCADMKEDNGYNKRQMDNYDWFISELEKKGVDIPIKHLCNSAGIIEFADKKFNMVRAGIITYGMYPSDEVRMDEILLKPALKWVTRVINVKNVEAGHGVSYGATYTTSGPTKIATLSVGYADGYPRALSNKGRVIINGQFAPIIGRVCMDQMMVDVSHIDDVQIEDAAILIGSDGDNTLTVEEVANMAGTFNYEFVCNISLRVNRIFI